MDCEFQLLDNNEWECLACGQKMKSGNPPHANCAVLVREHSVIGAEKIGNLDLLKHYSRSLARWTIAGFPVRTQEEIQKLHSICKGCDKYIDNSCSVCGCKVSTRRFPIVNKAAMKTENCEHPEGDKWLADYRTTIK